ncbi:DUF4062 domain-containing protein [Psychrobacter sp. I-STPA10]|uniref:DUF4062 domain-containing protein n=1 Tax=Psychrobacter sp. I-STPA10 TaxID=2585769 RepID=UPI001E4FBACD|nr:DUF4062 domain-containing protein [Psychrobacter sp. I-STPA10]
MMRYHAHIIKVTNEQPLVSSQLALFFERQAFLTQDLPVISTETMNYSRRCIESCDFVIMIIGESYGETNMSGVSQMHLSYLTAKAKRKPMLIFINTNNTGTWERQRQDFVSLVEAQNQQHITYYQYEQVFAQYLNNVFKNFMVYLTDPTWSSHNAAAMQGASLTSSQQVASLQTNSNEFVQTPSSYKTQATQATKSQDDIERQLLAELGAPLQNTEMVSIDDMLSVDYLAHAYQDGNLREVSLTEVLTWRQILVMLSKLNQPFTTDTLARCLNTHLSKMAVEHITSVMPKAHAVSRCQIKKSVLRYVLQQLCDNQWLRQSVSNQSTSRELWQLTSQALQVISNTSA